MDDAVLAGGGEGYSFAIHYWGKRILTRGEDLSFPELLRLSLDKRRGRVMAKIFI